MTKEELLQWIFQYYFDLLDANSFDISYSQGSVVKNIGGNWFFENKKLLSNFDIRVRLEICGSHINLDGIYDQNTNFTMLFHSSMKQSSQLSLIMLVSGIINVIIHFPPFWTIKNDKFTLKKRRKTILSSYQNKNLLLWFTKRGNEFKIALCNGSSMISETISAEGPFQANIFLIYLPYFVHRFGFAINSYNVNEKEFHKIIFSKN